MKKKIIVFISVLLSICLIFSLLVISNANVENFNASNQLEYREIKLDSTNCKYQLNEQTHTVLIEEYKGSEDCVVVPEEIEGYKVENIDVESFSDCYNLETIKIPVEIAENIENIPNFDVNEENVDENYVVYTTTREYSEVYKGYLELEEEEKAKVGIIPNKFDVPIEKIYSEEMQNLYSVTPEVCASIPSSFDLRDYIDIEVENQKKYGNCYVYSSFSSIETNLALIKNEIVNLSEIHGAVMTTGYGGSLFTASGSYYANKIGPVFEEDFAMDDIYENTSNINYQLINAYLKGTSLTSSQLQQIRNFVNQKEAVKYVTQTTSFPAITKSMKNTTSQKETVKLIRNIIKQHIMNYGSVATCIASQNYATQNGYTVMNDQTSSAVDHGVSIVGWDDNFSKDNFPAAYKPSKDGAYLVLNSWGETWGNNGYFWVSYEDQFIESYLVGVTSVKEVTENITDTSMSIKNIETNEIIDYAKIEVGTNVEITLEMTLQNVLENTDFEVKLRDSVSDFSEYVTVSEENIVNNIATLSINFDTDEFAPGEYIIEVTYGNDTVSKLIKILADFEYEINSDGTITITQYIGENKDVIVPSIYHGYTVSKIGNCAFEETAIESVTIADSVTSIGVDAFYYCINLKEVILPKSLSVIEEGVFWGCTSLESIELPNGITSVGPYAFEYCYGLTNITIPDKVKTIGEYAFAYCEVLEQITLSKELTSIGEYAFGKCLSLKEITIPEKMTKISEGTFFECIELEKVYLPDGLKVIDAAVFEYCEALSSITLPESLVSLGEYCFAGCTSLKEITIPEKVYTIGEGTFIDCTSLENINMPENLTTIGSGAFQKCTTLKEIVIPRSVTALGQVLFYGCTNLDKVIIFKETTEIGYDILYECPSATIYCEANSIAYYYALENEYPYYILSNYTVIYNSNSGDDIVQNMPSAQEKVEYEDIILSGKIPTREGYEFLGWSISETSQNIDYIPGQICNENSNLDLYAVWNATRVLEKINVMQYAFEDLETTYDGEAKMIQASGYDSEIVDVIYTIESGNDETSLTQEKAINVGTYIITAIFTIKDENLYVFKDGINTRTATLTITQKEGSITITNKDSLGKQYNEDPVIAPTYDKTGEGEVRIEYYIGSDTTGEALTGAPINVGTYTVKVILEETNNYLEASDIATFNITKATYDMTSVKFEDVSYEYDGKEKEILINGNLPEGVIVNYENNKATEVGTYNAVAKFTGDIANYEEIPDMNASLTITQIKGSIAITNKKVLTKVYDGTVAISPRYEKIGDGEVIIEYYKGSEAKGEIIDAPVGAGTYTVKVVLKESNNHSEAFDTATFDIQKANYDIKGIKFESATYEYDGLEKEIVISGELPEGVIVNYENNKATNPGIYNAVAKFVSDNENYNKIEDMTATLTIKEIEIDFGKYEISEYNGNNYLGYIEEGTTLKEFKEQISTENLVVCKDDVLIEDDEEILVTGTEIRIEVGPEIKTYIVIIKGDITRDGKVDDSDLLMLARYMIGCETEKEYVNDVSLKAADIYEDGEFADDKDLLNLAKNLLK